MNESRPKHTAPPMSVHRRVPALLAAMATILLSACGSPGALATQTTTPLASTSTVRPHSATRADADTAWQQMAQQLQDMQAQLESMQDQINEMHSQQRTLTQLINIREAIRPSPHPDAQPDKRDTLTQAQNLYRAGLYTQAVTALRDADGGGNGSKVAQERMLLLMQSHWHLHNCESVINIGNRFVSRFARHPQAPQALYQVGQCQARMQQRDMARNTWRKLMAIYPDSAAAKKAWQQLKP